MIQNPATKVTNQWFRPTGKTIRQIKRKGYRDAQSILAEMASNDIRYCRVERVGDNASVSQIDWAMWIFRPELKGK